MAQIRSESNKSLLLHACCGPCSIESTRALAEEGYGLAIDYINPNIHPQAEYQLRLETLKEYVAEPRGIDVIEGAYDPEEWEAKVGVYGTDREARCRACYRLRLTRAAADAKRLGYNAISTTLTISPYQYTQVILEELQAAADEQGLEAVCRDFRPLYAKTTQRSRELGMYRQNYCGCRFSVQEAAEEREQRKAQHARQQQVKHEAMLMAAAEGLFTQKNQI